MTNMEEKSFMDKDSAAFYIFTESEIFDQKDEMVVYMLTKLTNPTVKSLQESILEIKKLTGYNISIEAAMLIRRLGRYLEYKNAQEESISHSK